MLVAATIETVEYVIAQYEYAGDTAEDLSFNEGDKIVVLERVGDDWLRGELGGQQGLFPRVFVGDIIEEKKTAPSQTPGMIHSSPICQFQSRLLPSRGPFLSF